jgi:membrane protein
MTGWRERADAPVARLAILWLRRYVEASRNSGAAASAYVALSLFPTALVFVAAFSRARGSENVFADRLIDHLNLDGPTADLVADLFGTTSDNLLAASVAALISFAVWGLSIGQLYQGVYARAWHVRLTARADQWRYTIWLLVAASGIGLMALTASELRDAGWLAVLPAWIVASVAFWLWTPRFLLHRAIPYRALLPGTALATVVVGGTVATSPLWIGPTLNENAKVFGTFGVVMGLLAYTLIAVTISMVCAVFGPVWGEWRHIERARTAPTTRADDIADRPDDPPARPMQV